MMRSTVTRVLPLVLLLALSAPAVARQPLASPDKLLARAELVVNAVPIKVVRTDIKGQKAGGAVPTRQIVAHLRVIGVIKGNAATEIELHYPALDVGAIRGALIDGPLDVAIDPGRRYRFYLRQVPGERWYVTALDGELDDQGAVQPLREKEPDDSPPLLQQEAKALADAFVRSHHTPRDPGAASAVIARYLWSEPAWDFTYYSGDPASYPEGASDAEVVVAGDRSIDARSWVADAIFRSADAVMDDAIGRAVHLVLRPPDPLDPPETVSGRVNAVAADAIQLYGSSLRTPLSDLTIPKSDIVTVVRLAE